MPHDKKKPKIALVISIGGKPKKDDKKKYGDAMPHNAMNKAWVFLKTYSGADDPNRKFDGGGQRQYTLQCQICKQNKGRMEFDNPQWATEPYGQTSVICQDCEKMLAEIKFRNQESRDALYGPSHEDSKSGFGG